MAKYTVNVGENTLLDRRRLSLRQWMEFLSAREVGVKEGRTRVFDLREPITVSVVAKDGDKPITKICRKSWDILPMFSKGIVTAVRWRSGELGPGALHQLNTALRTGAVRKDGLNVVRHWEQARRGFLRDDLFALFSFLEIRPVYRAKTPQNKPSPTLKIRAS
ncbi:MAG: hypothetical protein AAB262_09135 [Elusimicrobiota bacterium]